MLNVRRVSTAKMGELQETIEDIFVKEEEQNDDEESTSFWHNEQARIVNHNSKAIMKWSMIVMVLSIVSVVITPVELAFLEVKFDGIFFFNRILELIFLCDIILSFNLTFQDPETGELLAKRRSIALNYMRFWFWMDLAVVVPYDLLAMGNSGGGSSIKIVKLVRLMRVVRLVRVLKASNVFEKYYADFSVNFNVMEGLKMLFITLFLIHLMACGLVYTAVNFPGEGDWTWLHDNEVIDWSGKDLYLIAFYWATMTVSTIGYGDIALVTQAERVYAICCMIIGASTYACITGQLCTLIISMTSGSQLFKSQLGVLNSVMADNHVPADSQALIRKYFMYTKAKRIDKEKKFILEFLSPHLKSIILVNMHVGWLRQIPFFVKTLDGEFISAVASVVHENAYAPKEKLALGKSPILEFHYVSQGIIVYGKRWLTKNRYFGEAVICQQPGFHSKPAASFGFSQTRSMERKDLHAILGQSRFKSVAKQVRRAAIKIRFRAIGATMLRQMATGASIKYGRRLSSMKTLNSATALDLLASDDDKTSLTKEEALKEMQEIQEQQKRLTSERKQNPDTSYSEESAGGNDLNSQAVVHLRNEMKSLQQEIDLKHKELAIALGRRLDMMEKRIVDDLKQAMMVKNNRWQQGKNNSGSKNVFCGTGLEKLGLNI